MVGVHCTQQDGRCTLETQNGAKKENKKRKRKSEEEIEKNGETKRIRGVKESFRKGFLKSVR
jgi:hypothetical protein